MANEIQLSATYSKENNLINWKLYVLIPFTDIQGAITLVYQNVDIFNIATDVELAKSILIVGHFNECLYVPVCDATNPVPPCYPDCVSATGRFLNPQRIIDLSIRASITIDTVTYTHEIPILDLPNKKTLSQNIVEGENPPPPNETIVDTVELVDELKPILVHLDFDLERPLKEGLGPLIYSGGGNRYLSNRFNKIIEQPLNVAPWDILSTTFIEDSIENVLSNNDFSQITGDIPTGVTGVPVGYTASQSDVIVTSSVTSHSDIDSNEWVLRYRLGKHVSPTIENSDLISIDISKPLIIAMFFGLSKNSSTLNLKTISFKANFYSNIDTPLGSKDNDYSVNDLLDTLSVIQNSVLVSEYPANTAKVSFELVLKSFVEGDDAQARLILPQITQTRELSTFIRNATTRVRDIITIPQSDNINPSKGMVIIRFIPNYNGFYPYPSGGYLFDSRDNAERYGFACWHRDDGRFEFFIDIGGINYTMVSNPVTLQSDVIEIKVLWDQANSIRKILKDNIEIGADFNSFNVPTSLHSVIHLGCKTGGSAYLGCQLLEFKIMKTID